jgi:lysine 2,3-aminomutase
MHRGTIKTAAALLADGLIPAERAEEIGGVAERYAIGITPAIRGRMGPSADDPVALQFVPSGQELIETPDERADPIGDEPHTTVPGITHRYRDRVLLKPLHVCPVYCRFCFRREVVGPGNGFLGTENLARALAYIREHEEIWEVILSGGDPLLLSPARLRRIVAGLNAIEHVRVIRVHTRVPVVAPQRITEELLTALTADTPVWVVLHCNHRQELGRDAFAALGDLARRGFPLLSQTVLLKGVNDTPEALEELFRTLVEHRVKPYYLHQTDLARGTSHFRTSIASGQATMRKLRGQVSGLCQPTYVLDIPGGYGKVPIGPEYLEPSGDGHLVTDPHGSRHRYPPVPS